MTQQNASPLRVQRKYIRTKKPPGKDSKINNLQQSVADRIKCNSQIIIATRIISKTDLVLFPNGDIFLEDVVEMS